MYTPRTLIHLGLPKTATSTLQKHLFEGHEQVFYLGRNFGNPYDYNDQEHAALARSLRSGTASAQDLERLAGRVADYRKAAGEGCLVWSDEGASSGSRDHRRKFLDHVAAVYGDVRIAVTLRRPVDWLQSQYWQYVCRSQTLKPAPLATQSIEFPSVSQWFAWQKQRPDEGELIYMDYAATVEIAVERFGIDNVRVFVYEQYVGDLAVLASELCSFAGIDAEQGRRLTSGNRVNTRASRETVRRIETLAGSPKKTAAFFRMEREDRRSALADSAYTPAPPGDRAETIIPDGIRSEIEDKTRAGNRWLIERLGLPLDELGYPL